MFHEPPLLLVIAGLLHRLPNLSLVLIFSLIDAFNTYLVIDIASKFFPPSSSLVSVHLVSGLFYALNPFAILAAVGASTAVLPNTFVLLALYFAALSNSTSTPSATICFSWLAAASLSVAIYLCYYWILLVAPLLLFAGRTGQQPVSTFVSIFTLVGNLTALFVLSTAYVGNWHWVFEVYGFQMQVAELTPNIGPLWYLFTEMFAEYLTFFEFAMQAFIFVLAVPLAVRFRHDPLVLWWLLVSIVATLRPYLSVADLGLQLGLLGLLHEDYPQLEHKTLMSATAVALGVLAPIFHNMWLYTGTGNANFYFALAIVLAFLQVCLVSGMVSAALTRHYLKKLAA